MDHTLALIERIHQGDKEARDTLFSENMGLCIAQPGVSWEEEWNWRIFSKSAALVF